MRVPALASGLALAAILAILPSRGRGLHRLAGPNAVGVSDRRRLLSIGGIGLAHTARRRLGILAAAVVGAAVLAGSLGLQLVVSIVALGVITTVIFWQRAKHRRRSAGAALRVEVIEACDVLSADLTAGRPPAEALEGATTICADLRIASAACRLGGDVPAALDLAAESPGAEGLRALASAWRVAEESGAAFAGIVDRLADSLRADEAIRRQTAASLAGARATARLLAVLPFFGAALGYALGADPIAFLTGLPVGWISLAAGLGLSVAGLAWTDRLAEAS
ncbi:type II secretion system protein [Kribbella qitaiheensis]|uniref:Type II secretion system protein n=1 Tax=Kribbella qitaiheensis TaxID=1544730 RepID=A0A7G6X253_9ACTN|nr:type II secretion system F family protein [Kribbella qitaiheensis]QNE20318.1 type II secretion system protein [Kribbella qitaiheensis]